MTENTLTPAEVAVVNAKFAKSLARKFDESKSTFDRAKEAFNAREAGGTFREIADMMSLIAAESGFPDADAEKQKSIAESNPKQGGTKVAFQKLFTYELAYRVVVDSALVPTSELVNRGFTLVTLMTKKEDREAFTLAVSEHDQSTRAAEFLRLARESIDALNAARAEKRAKAASEKEEKEAESQEAGEQVSLTEFTPEHFAGVLAHIVEHWDGEQAESAARLMKAALRDLAAKAKVA